MPSSNNASKTVYSTIASGPANGNIQKIEFTRREIEILKLIKRGKTTKVIAVELNISASTVKKHRENMMKKVEAENMTELVVVVASRGLL